MKKCLIILGILAIATTASFANFDWGAYYYFYEAAGTTFLTSDASEANGCFVQLIHDVNGDGLDAAVDNGGNGINAASDDVVYMGAWLGIDGGANQGQFTASVADVAAGASEDNYVFYGRVWSAAAATWNGVDSTIDTGVSTYWDGLAFSFDNDAPSPVYNMTAEAGLGLNANVNLVPAAIPEPTVIAMGLLGIALIRGLRKIKK